MGVSHRDNAAEHVILLLQASVQEVTWCWYFTGQHGIIRAQRSRSDPDSIECFRINPIPTGCTADAAVMDIHSTGNTSSDYEVCSFFA